MGDTEQQIAETTLYCANHPNVETLLRCNKCGKPICIRCGIRTPVGVRCRACAHMQRLPMYRAGVGHYLLAMLVALPASFLAGFVMQQMGPFLAFFLGAAVGGLVAEIVYRITHKRGRLLALLVCACIVIGALGSSLVAMGFGQGIPIAALANGPLLVATFMRLNIIYVILAVGAAFARLI